MYPGITENSQGIQSLVKDEEMTLATKQLISREPEVPDLSEEDIRQITAAVFIKEDTSASDLLFIFGARQGNWQTYAHFIHAGKAQNVLVAGGYLKEICPDGETLAMQIKRRLLHYGISENHILVQSRSTNTKEDVTLSLPVLASAGIIPERLTFACKSHHSGRCFLTLKKYFPEVTLKALICIPSYQGREIKAESWWKHPVSKQRVYGEYLRILHYAQRGDIAFP